ncbi:hypothetical protein N7499_003179 [Penicillium canescens]|uniref:Heterokaryon incompatibility domain-containing protein n=1 Tax=Penicillium canescens TaxID=5083 RepID=A0AAD6I9W0_PENCN|nr:hypothetical protein N7522_000446 [Penicillium canescens]KAJ6038617.1 hypothetical protein N7460_007334 [Penicillium canescens]KAJ6060012.1 hypothetical protein N7444_002944 [Penicillium canescens]KAJ6093848.1 hypothetical protein N7499_003179 [Penicillium canescens]KAJ6174366.1 hypothetical protein N7485_005432 [Penicillium canescens]
MTIRTLYSYKPIQHNQLRLLKFVSDGIHISAILEAFSVEEPLPPFHSVSYTWASNGASLAKSWAVQIEKQMLPVLDSLQSFIQTLASKDMLLDGKWWWIDSICINQDNLEERAQQVQLMQHIYVRAEQVIIWLGDESSDSNLAMDFIRFLDKTAQQRLSVDNLRTMLQTEQYYPQWTALTNLLARRWWSRIWTVQEFVLPRSISFWCGMRNVSRVAVCRSISIADKCTSIGIKETPGFTHGNNRRRVWGLYKAGRKPGATLNLSILALAAYFSCMNATDDRDRIYGLMALSIDGSLLDVNYFLSSQEVYLRFTQAFIARHKSLDIICFTSLFNAPGSTLRPSWVPHWQKTNPLVIPLMVSQSCMTHIGNLRTPKALAFDPSICYSASKNRAAEYKFEGSALFARGVIVDTVDGLAGSRNFDLVQSSEGNAMEPPSFPGSTFYSSSTEILMGVCRSLALDRKDRYLRYAMPTAEFFRDFVGLLSALVLVPEQDSATETPKELQIWFDCTRSLQIHRHNFESILRDSSHQADIEPPGPEGHSTPNQDEYYHDTFFGRFFDTVVRLSLRLMVSRNGHIGMVSERAMKGDLICVLFGCSVPVLLRKSEQDNCVTFVGECFLDGCMDGSALERPELIERTFRIR